MAGTCHISVIKISIILTMYLTSWILASIPAAVSFEGDVNSFRNSSDSTKDMYVIHAMIYQVGIITNKTDENETHPTNIGNEESVTFFRNNGSIIDLSDISEPLMTNVTAQRVVGISPSDSPDTDILSPLSNSKIFSSLPSLPNETGGSDTRISRDTEANLQDQSSDTRLDEPNDIGDTLLAKLLQRHVRDDSPVKIEQGSAAIPLEAGIQSLAIPPLLSFNSNYSEIPVPIPNMSVVHYAKVNTLVKNVP